MRQISWKLHLAVTALIAVFALGAPGLQAQDPKATNSLKGVPADAAFYGTSLRHKEMLDRVTSSKAYKEMVEHKVLSTAIAQGTGLYDSQLNNFKTQNPEAWAAMRGFYEQGIELLGDMMSHECFWYGGKGWVEVTPRVQALSNKFNALASQFAQLPEEERNAKLLEVLDDSEVQKLLSDLRTPETVLGFKVTNKQLADDYLTVVAAGVKQAIASNPEAAPFARTYRRETVSGGAFHVFTLDMSLLTPDVLAKIGDSTPNGEQVVAVINKLKPLLKNWKITISLGRIEDYLLVSISNDNQHLANWGKGKLLVDSAEFAPLRKASDKKFTDISYTSEAIAALAANPAALEGQKAQIRQIQEQLAQAGVSGELPITEDSIKKITELYLEDMDKLQKLISEQVNPRASLSFTYDVEEGFETMSYQFGEEKNFDGKEELSILSHVGKEPIWFVAGRAKEDEKSGEVLSYLAHRVLEVVDAIEFGDDEEGKKNQEILDKAAEKGKPLVEKFVKITKEKIIPALEDGQSAFILDANLSADRLDPAMPPAEAPLLLPEVAIVIGVSDSGKLREGLKQYLELGRELISAMREVSPEAIPDGATIPDPEVSKEEGGELASYVIPTDQEIVGKILLPTLGLGEEVAVFALHRETAQRLLAESELEAVAEGLEESLEKPLAGASQFDFHRLMDLTESYVAYASQLGAFDQAAAATPFSADEVKEQIELVLNFLRCYERSTSVTYVEDGATVTKSISVFSDYQADDK